MKHTGTFPFFTIFIFYIAKINYMLIYVFLCNIGGEIFVLLLKNVTSMLHRIHIDGLGKTAVTSLLTHWSYYSLALNHWYVFLCNICRKIFILLAKNVTGMLHRIHIWVVHWWTQPLSCVIFIVWWCMINRYPLTANNTTFVLYQYGLCDWWCVG